MEQCGIKCEIKEFLETTKTAADAARVLNCELGQIAKSIIFEGRVSHEPILIITSGPNRINELSIQKEVGEEVVKADADFVRKKQVLLLEEFHHLVTSRKLGLSLMRICLNLLWFGQLLGRTMLFFLYCLKI